jgi:hypothetical protein
MASVRIDIQERIVTVLRSVVQGCQADRLIGNPHRLVTRVYEATASRRLLKPRSVGSASMRRAVSNTTWRFSASANCASRCGALSDSIAATVRPGWECRFWWRDYD